jgi:hypothetical protein
MGIKNRLEMARHRRVWRKILLAVKVHNGLYCLRRKTKKMRKSRRRRSRKRGRRK